MKRDGRLHGRSHGLLVKSGRAGILAFAVALLAAVTGSMSSAGQLEGIRDDPRPFRHEAHETLTCGECHGTGPDHRTILVRTSADCAACHHEPARGMECAACHDESGYGGVREVSTTFSLTVWDASRQRPLDFRHDLHRETSCRECHAGEGLLAPVGCVACHENHHRPQVECGACHQANLVEAHSLSVHQSCAGSGCHMGDSGLQPEFTRDLCLLCHTEQTDHQPDGNCHVCHAVSPSRGAGATVSGGLIGMSDEAGER
jgi:hypothetical protein